MLHFAVYLRQVVSGTFRTDEDPDGRRISEKVKLVRFIARRTRPKVMISDYASVFKSTATWMKNIRKSERLHDYLARQDIN